MSMVGALLTLCTISAFLIGLAMGAMWMLKVPK